ncbi:hypothetical protein C8F01DRAFT_331097 [Mycena amicta]|nr:hypothetical protein C8F01DRAFT_331097 [Mycena amicta]
MYAPSVEIDIVPGLIFVSSWTSPIGRREHSRIIVIGACAQLQCTMLALFIYRIPIPPTHPALSFPRRRRLLVLRPLHPSLLSFASDHRRAMPTHNGSGNESTSQIYTSHGAHPQQPPRLIQPLLERICDAHSPLPVLGLPAAEKEVYYHRFAIANDQRPSSRFCAPLASEYPDAPSETTSILFTYRYARGRHTPIDIPAARPAE